MKFSYKKTFMFGLVFFSISLLNSLHDTITPKILNGVFSLNPTQIGTIMAIDNILALILLPVFGFISDRTATKMGKRKPYIFFGTIVSAVLLVMLPIAAQANILWLFVICVTVLLIALSSYRAPGVSLVSDFTIKPHRSLANGVINLMGAFSTVVGMVLVMFLYKDIGESGTREIPLIVIYFVTAIIGVVAMLTYFFGINEKKWIEEREKTELKLGYATIEEVNKSGKEKIVLGKAEKISFGLIIATIMLWSFGYDAVMTFFSLYAEKILGMKDGSFAIVLTIAQVAGVACCIPSGITASKIGRKKTILIGIAALFFALFGASFVKTLPIMIALFIVAGFGVAFINVNTLPMITEFSKTSSIGRFTSIYYLVSSIAASLSPITAGAVMELCAKLGIAGVEGYGALFPFGCFFLFLSALPIMFAKHGDAKPLEPTTMLANFED